LEPARIIDFHDIGDDAVQVLQLTPLKLVVGDPQSTKSIWRGKPVGMVHRADFKKLYAVG